MLFFSFFTNAGVPATGLSPVIDIWDSANTLIINNQTMTELSGGFYKYDFTGYVETTDYVIRADGGNTLSNSERYVYASNETAYNGLSTIDRATLTTINTNSAFANNIEGGKWEIVSNQMIFYKSDNTTEIARFNLFDSDGNPSSTEVYKRERA